MNEPGPEPGRGKEQHAALNSSFGLGCVCVCGGEPRPKRSLLLGVGISLASSKKGWKRFGCFPKEGEKTCSLEQGRSFQTL